MADVVMPGAERKEVINRVLNQWAKLAAHHL
jgi:hypothetical protein